MKISGFTIIKNAILNDYPIVEAITSILPVVDEMIVLIGDCDDETETLIASIADKKIIMHHSVWNPNLRSGGEVLAEETNKALALIDSASDWAFYIQADEILHEKYHASIRPACEKYLNDKRVLGLLFKYVHFYGTYDYIGDSRRWYDKEVRIIRNAPGIAAYKDAQGFRINNDRLPVKPIDAFIYHYGWVKSPKQMLDKHKNVTRYWYTDDVIESVPRVSDVFDFEDFDSLAKFEGTHPAVMLPRIKKQNWDIPIDISKKKFTLKDKLLYHFEKITGIRLFGFKNYRTI